MNTLVLCMAALVFLGVSRTTETAFCYRVTYAIDYRIEYYTANCGWWGWARCPRSRTVSQTTSMPTLGCCSGYTGRNCDERP